MVFVLRKFDDDRGNNGQKNNLEDSTEKPRLDGVPRPGEKIPLITVKEETIPQVDKPSANNGQKNSKETVETSFFPQGSAHKTIGGDLEGHGGEYIPRRHACEECVEKGRDRSRDEATSCSIDEPA